MNDSNTRNSSGSNVSPLKRNKLPPTGGKLMRLRSRFRTLHESYLINGRINDRDADVTFVTMDGQKVRGHKIILAAASTFFVSMFSDQQSGEMTTVMVPDVREETLRLILQLAYTDSISVTMKQIKEVGSFISLFGMEWKQFNFDGFDDVSPSQSTSISKPAFTVSSVIRQNQSPGIKPITVTPDMVTMNQNFGKNPTRLSNNSIQKSLLQRQKETFRPEQKESDNFTFKLQGYGESGTGNSNYVSPGGKQLPLGSRLKQQLTAPLHTRTYSGSAANSSRGARLQGRSDNPRIESNYDGYASNDTNFQGVNSNNEEAQKMIKEWMAKVGKEEEGTPAVKKFKMAAPVNRPKVIPRSVTPPLAANQAVNTCTVCNGEFSDRQAWKWHEERHIGMGIFKCGYCNLLFGTTKKLLLHEEVLHNSNVPEQIKENLAENEEEQDSDSGGNVRKRKLIPRSEFQEEVVQTPTPTVPRLKLIKSRHGTQYQRVPAKLTPQQKMALKLKSVATGAKFQKAASSRMADIGIGVSPGTELMDSKKVKQLHWLYNCLKCDSCSDASSKAIDHYYKCYPDKELAFEKTVVKYRQGFYGKYRCPLCPRRYTSIGGFVIHCGHMHTGYRKKFNQTQSGEIKCTKCEVVFNLPSQFDEHMSGGQCPAGKNPATAVEESSPKGDSPKPKAVGSSKMPRLSSSNSRGIVYENPYDDMLAKRRSQTLTGRSPRSARLANRLINETLAKNSENLDESTFKDIDCPICGADSIKNINHHLTSDHSELGVEVQRLSEDLLRCLKCKLTFAICDLFSHSNSCTGSKEFEFVKQRNVLAAVKTSQHPPVERRKLEIPPGVGNSPIDVIDNDNLCTLETFTNALKCSVCGKTAKKLGVILECMKSHGVHRCALCFNTYLQKVDYSAHLKRCHGQGVPNGKISCPICSKISVNTGQVASHMYLHHWMPLLREKKQDNATEEDTSKISEKAKDGDLKIPDAAEEEAVDLNASDVNQATDLKKTDVIVEDSNGKNEDTPSSSLQKTSNELKEPEISKEAKPVASVNQDSSSKVEEVESKKSTENVKVDKGEQEKEEKANDEEVESQKIAETDKTENMVKPEEKVTDPN